MSSSDPHVPLALRDEARALLAACDAELGALYGLKQRIAWMIDDGYLSLSGGEHCIVMAGITDCSNLCRDQHALVRAINGQTSN